MPLQCLWLALVTYVCDRAGMGVMPPATLLKAVPRCVLGSLQCSPSPKIAVGKLQLRA